MNIKAINFVLVLLLSLPASASPVTFIQGDPIRIYWQAPTTRENGRELHPDEISGYTVIWQCDASGDDSLFTENTEMHLPSSLLGQCYIATFTTDTNGLSSAPSPSIQLLIKLPKPTRGGFR